MAPEGSSGKPEGPKRPAQEPLTPAKQKRLEQLFEHGKKQMSQSDHAYANDLLSQCVEGDPSNLSYLQAFVGNLQRKYKNNKSGSKLARILELGARGAVKKALSAEDWNGVIKQGMKVLKVNPWDKAALLAMSMAQGKMGHIDPQMFLLKCAREPNPKDPDVNRQTAKALARLGQHDAAIAMWHKVEQELPDDEEAAREIAKLAVEKAMAHGGFSEAEEAKIRDHHAPVEGEEQQTEESAEKRLRRKIKLHPKDMSFYYELAEIYIGREDYKTAAEVFADAFEASDGDQDIRERWEDIEVRHLRQQEMLAERKGDEELKKKNRAKRITKEVEVYKNRCERYPSHLGYRYDLGLRYQMAGQYNDAIKEFQRARNDPRRKGACMLALGQCFQQVRQYRLAMSHYESAIAEIPDRDATNKKLALYQGGKMALYLKDLDKSEQCLSTLAGLDFTYKDVSELLDKIAALREQADQKPIEEEDESDEDEG